MIRFLKVCFLFDVMVKWVLDGDRMVLLMLGLLWKIVVGGGVVWVVVVMMVVLSRSVS